MTDFVALIILAQLYYWFYWLPRNWRDVPDAVNLVFSAKEIYGNGNHNTYKTIRRYKIRRK